MTPVKRAQSKSAGTLRQRPKAPQTSDQAIRVPAAGAHAADRLVNEDATPGAGALTNLAHPGQGDVDGGAG